MAKRVKTRSRPPIEVRDWQHADELVREVGDLQAQIARSEAWCKRQIDGAKAELQARAKPAQARIKEIALSLEAFATAHQRDFVGRRRSKDLAHGKIGWRQSMSMRIAKDTLDLIRRVFGGKASRFIATKETVDKRALYDLTDEDLAAIHAERVTEDVFYIEPEAPRAVDHGAA